MVNAMPHRELLHPCLTAMRNSSLNLLLGNSALDVLAFRSLNDHGSSVGGFLHEDKGSYQQSACKCQTDPEEQSPGITSVEHIPSIQWTG